MPLHLHSSSPSLSVLPVEKAINNSFISNPRGLEKQANKMWSRIHSNSTAAQCSHSHRCTQVKTNSSKQGRESLTENCLIQIRSSTQGREEIQIRSVKIERFRKFPHIYIWGPTLTRHNTFDPTSKLKVFHLESRKKFTKKILNVFIYTNTAVNASFEAFASLFQLIL